jgi:hypothetical protein
MAVQNPPVKGGFEPPVMSFSGAVLVSAHWKLLTDARYTSSFVRLARATVHGLAVNCVG